MKRKTNLSGFNYSIIFFSPSPLLLFLSQFGYKKCFCFFLFIVQNLKKMQSVLGKRKLENPLELLDLPGVLVLEHILWYACLEEDLWDVLKLRLVCKTFSWIMDEFVMKKLPQYFPSRLLYGPSKITISSACKSGLSLPLKTELLRMRFPELKFQVHYAPKDCENHSFASLSGVQQIKIEPGSPLVDRNLSLWFLKDSVQRLTLIAVDPFPELPVFTQVKKISVRDCLISNEADEKELSRASYLKLSNCVYVPSRIFGQHHHTVKIEKARLSTASYFQNIRRVKLCDIELLDDVSPLSGVYSLTLVKCQNVKDVSPLAAVPHLTLNNLPMVTNVSMLTGVRRLKLLNLSSFYSTLESTSLQAVNTLIVFSDEEWTPQTYVDKGFVHLHYYALHLRYPSPKYFSTRLARVPTCQLCKEQRNVLFFFSCAYNHCHNIGFHKDRRIERCIKHLRYSTRGEDGREIVIPGKYYESK